MTTGPAMRNIVHIDEDKCDGCGLCVPNCAEGAIRIINGKAKLVAENLCDGLGSCLGACPQDAITIEQRPADPFDEQAVERNATDRSAPAAEEPNPHGGGCPGKMLRMLNQDRPAERTPTNDVAGAGDSELGHWPVQLTLLPESGKLWQGTDVLLAADCAAFAMGDFHKRLLAGRTLAIACPKLDDGDAYVEKLARILAGNSVRSITIARMEVPCCSLERIVHAAMDKAGKTVPITVVTVSVAGKVAAVNGLRVD